MADNRNIIVFDFETTGRDTSKVDILQIGAVIIDRNSLKIKDEFECMMQPNDMSILDTEECKEALKVNHITKEQLETAPQAKTMFPVFANWIMKHNTKKGSFGAPIPAGWGIDNYDMPIFNRYCNEYGYWDNKWSAQTLMNPIFTLDAMKHLWFWTRNNKDVDNLKLGTILEYMGVSKQEIAEGAHNALWDVKWSAQIIIKLLRVGMFLTEIKTGDGKRRLEMKGCLADIKI